MKVLIASGASAVAIALAMFAVPRLFADQTFYIQLLLAAVTVTGLSLFMGFAGQASLGQGAFVAIGALTVAEMTTKWGLPPLLALVCAPVVSAAFAYLVGAPLLRLRGHYLAFATLALLLVVQSLMTTVPFFSGEYGTGISGIPPLGIGSAVISSQDGYVVVAVAALAVTILVAHNVVNSRFGRGMRALATSESAAAASGVPVLRTKLATFAIAAAFAGLAGGIQAFFIPFVSGDSFPALTSITYVIMAVIGGAGTIWGGLVGAVIVSVISQVLNAAANAPGVTGNVGAVLQYAAYAAVLILALLFIPHGVVPAIRDATRRWRTRLSSRRAGIRGG